METGLRLNGPLAMRVWWIFRSIFRRRKYEIRFFNGAATDAIGRRERHLESRRCVVVVRVVLDKHMAGRNQNDLCGTGFATNVHGARCHRRHACVDVDVLVCAIELSARDVHLNLLIQTRSVHPCAVQFAIVGRHRWLRDIRRCTHGLQDGSAIVNFIRETETILLQVECAARN